MISGMMRRCGRRIGGGWGEMGRRGIGALDKRGFAGPVVPFRPEGDSRLRLKCEECDYILYANPRPVGGVVVSEKDEERGGRRVLLVQRSITPRKGFWTVPGGYLEIGESSAVGAAREAWEEACAKVEVENLLAILDVPHAGSIMMFFRARMEEERKEGVKGVGDERIGVGEECDDVRWFHQDDIPWKDLAFPTTTHALKFFLEHPDNDKVLYEPIHEKIGPERE